MTDPHSPEAHAHAGPTFNTYLAVFGALSVFTLLSFVFNYMARHQHLSTEAGFVLILGVAVCKAILVGMFFMHLIMDWGRVYYLILTAMILGTLLIVVLLPDIVLTWHHVTSTG